MTSLASRFATTSWLGGLVACGYEEASRVQTVTVDGTSVVLARGIA